MAVYAHTHTHSHAHKHTFNHFVALFGSMHQSNISPVTIATRIQNQVALLLFYLCSRRRLQYFPLSENLSLFWPCHQFGDRNHGNQNKVWHIHTHTHTLTQIHVRVLYSEGSGKKRNKKSRKTLYPAWLRLTLIKFTTCPSINGTKTKINHFQV